VTSSSQVVESGPGLAFVVYPTVVARMSLPYLPANLWAFAFFAMLVSLALGSIFGAFETVLTAACDGKTGLR
jgi:solute carrier family 6 amino acid transporter-like protein 5/7/9/14